MSDRNKGKEPIALSEEREGGVIQRNKKPITKRDRKKRSY